MSLFRLLCLFYPGIPLFSADLYSMALFEKYPIQLTNSIGGKKEQFQPVNPGHVGMYVCGPTVYSDVHLGNVRTFLTFDTISRYFRYLGYKVRYVRNITDVGHLENDADEGEVELADGGYRPDGGDRRRRRRRRD